MKTTSIIFLLLIAVLIGISTWAIVNKNKFQSVGQGVENPQKKAQANLVNQIQKDVDLINAEKSYVTKTLNNEQFMGKMTDGGGQLTGYFKDGKIYKIEEKQGLSYGAMSYKYYFSDGKVILINEREEDFPDTNNTGELDYTKLELAFEGYYYFDQEKLIDMKTTGKKRFSGNSQTDTDSLIKAAKENVDLLTK